LKKRKHICEMHDDDCPHDYRTSEGLYCLTCHHTGEDHVVMQDWFSRVMYRIVGISGCAVGPWCKCKRFVPNDNLKYLEELVK
jgi:hypothetical protein